MARSAPLAISYSAALASTSSIVGRHRVTAVASTGGLSWRSDVSFRNGQGQRVDCGSMGSLFRPLMIPSGRSEATVANATESAAGVAASVEDHTTDPNEMFRFDLLEYESTNGPVCLTSFVPKYDSSHFEQPAALETKSLLVSDEPALVQPESPLEVPQPSPAEVAPADVTSKLVVEEPAVVQTIEADLSTTKPASLPRLQSPFARYPDLKSPSSPTPSPPANVSATMQQTVVVEPPAEVESSAAAALVTAADDPVAPTTPPESRRVESVPWIPVKPQSPYTRFPDLKPPSSPTPRPPSL